jgi:hypothetical protein
LLSGLKEKLMKRMRTATLLASLFFLAPGIALADCPVGFEEKNGQCEIKMECAAGMVKRGGQCVAATTCPDGTRYLDGFCVTNAPASTVPNAPPGTKQ